jgi:hypothetical protein
MRNSFEGFQVFGLHKQVRVDKQIAQTDPWHLRRNADSSDTFQWTHHPKNANRQIQGKDHPKKQCYV